MTQRWKHHPWPEAVNLLGAFFCAIFFYDLFQRTKHFIAAPDARWDIRLGPSNAKRFWGYFWMGKASENDCDGRFWAAFRIGQYWGLLEETWKISSTTKHFSLGPQKYSHRSVEGLGSFVFGWVIGQGLSLLHSEAVNRLTHQILQRFYFASWNTLW